MMNCKECGRTFKDQESFDYHRPEEICLGQIPWYPCDCGKAYRSEEDLNACSCGNPLFHGKLFSVAKATWEEHMGIVG